jgi:Fe-Mn family superoxide dismutase
MNFEVPALPYAKDALEPVMSSKTLEFHYEKHHKGYMVKLEAALKGTADAGKTLEEVVKTSSGGQT